MGKQMYGWPFSNRYFVAFILTLADGFLSPGLCIDPLWRERVTQTWLMRRYWLWLLWQLLIRDWLGTVAVCWGGRKETVCLDLIELPPLHPPTDPLGSLCIQTISTLKVLWNCTQRIAYCTVTKRYLMLNFWGREEIKADQEEHSAVLTLGFCSLRTIHPLCMVIKLSLRGCRLMGCCAEPREMWKQRNKRWRGLEEWMTGDIYERVCLISPTNTKTALLYAHEEWSRYQIQLKCNLREFCPS